MSPDQAHSIHFNVAFSADVLIAIFSWMTPYPWWHDGLIVLALVVWSGVQIGPNERSS